MKSGTHLRTIDPDCGDRGFRRHSVMLAATHGARADDPGKILKAMTDYLAGQKSLSAKFDSDIEVVTPELQKIQFTSSGEMKMNRPDKLRIRRTGGYADVELVYDGKTVSLYGNNAKSYVQADLAGTHRPDDRHAAGPIGRRHAGRRPPAVQFLRRADGQCDRLQAHRSGRRRRCRMRASRVSRSRDRLADLDRDRRKAGAAQICDHQQDRHRRAAIHAEDQGLEDGRESRTAILRSSRRPTRPRSRSIPPS